jgi:hypothetical protein
LGGINPLRVNRSTKGLRRGLESPASRGIQRGFTRLFDGGCMIGVRAVLVGDPSVAARGHYNASTPEGITAADPLCITGVDEGDGFVKMSMTSWRRLELLLKILATADIKVDEKAGI